jgi:Bacterial Ig-like domain (group 3)
VIYRSNTSAICALALFFVASGGATAQTTATTLTLSSSANPSVVGQQVTFGASVYGLAGPTGTVQFMDGSANLGAPATLFCFTSPCVASAASLQTSALTQGVHSITATYSGDLFNDPSSGALTQIVAAVAAASPTPTLSSWVATMLALIVAGVGITSIWRSRA